MITLVLPYNPLDELSGLQNLAKRWAAALSMKGCSVRIFTIGSSGRCGDTDVYGFRNLLHLCVALLRGPTSQVVHWLEVWPHKPGAYLQYLASYIAKRAGQTHTLGTGTPENLRRRGWPLGARHLLPRIFTGFVVPNLDFIEEYTGCGIPREQIAVVPQGLVSSEPFRPLSGVGTVEACRRIGLDPGRLHVLYLGRMVHRKRPHDFIAAAAAASEKGCRARFLMVGESWEHEDSVDESVHAAVETLDLDLIVVRPHTDRPWDYLAIADVVVLTSERDGEAFVVLEALASGSIVLVPDVPVLRTFHDEVPTAVRLYPVGDVQALAIQIIDLLADGDAREQARSDGPAYIATNRRLETLLDRYVSVYGESLTRREHGDG